MTAFAETKWGVEIVNGDSVQAAHSFEEAILQCNRINETLAKMFEKRVVGFDPKTDIPIYAKVIEWNENELWPHRPDETDWDNII